MEVTESIASSQARSLQPILEDPTGQARGHGDGSHGYICSSCRTYCYFSFAQAVALSVPHYLGPGILTTDSGLTYFQIPLSQGLSLRARVRGGILWLS